MSSDKKKKKKKEKEEKISLGSGNHAVYGK